MIAKGVSAAILRRACHRSRSSEKAFTDRSWGFDELSAFTRRLHLDIFTLSPNIRLLKTCLRIMNIFGLILKMGIGNGTFCFCYFGRRLEWGMRLLGLEEFFSMLRSPAALNDLIKEVEKRNFYQIDKLVDEGINGIILADDIAHQQGLFANPKILKENFIPSLARQAEKVRAKDLPVFYHSDGNYLPVLEEIVQAGFSGLQCLEKSAGMELEKLRDSFGDTLCYWGYIETEDLAVAADEEQLQALAAVHRNLAAGQKYILGTTSGLFAGMELQTLQKLYQMLS